MAGVVVVVVVVVFVVFVNGRFEKYVRLHNKLTPNKVGFHTMAATKRH